MNPYLKVTTPGKIGPYIIKEQIGCGRTSIVCRGIDISHEEEVAIKIVPKQQFRNQVEITKFQNEVSALFRCQNQYIVSLINLFHDTLNFYMVTELCSGGDLQSLISKNGRLPEKDAQIIFREIAEAMNFIHNMMIAHRDIKLENLLLDEQSRVKISDFGYSIINASTDEKSQTTKSRCGTLAYIAPEVLGDEPYNAFSTDVWSAGVVLYILTTGKFPWPTSNEEKMLEKIKSRDITPFPAVLSAEVVDLINMMTDLDPEKRPTFKQILTHPWVKEIKPPLFVDKYTHSQPNFNKINDIFRSALNQRVIVGRTSQSMFRRSKGDILSPAEMKKREEKMDKDLLEVLQKSKRRTKLRPKNEKRMNLKSDTALF